MNATAKRTTSRPVTPATPSESQMRVAMACYVECHLAAERIALDAKEKIEAIKKAAAAEAKEHLDTKASCETTLLQYAEGHPELFDKRQKFEVYGGHKIGWQVNPPAATLIKAPGMKKKQTWDGFLSSCHESTDDRAEDFIRKIEEPDKEALLKGYRLAAQLDAEEGSTVHVTEYLNCLRTLGVTVMQEENFVIDLNLQPTAAPADQPKAAA